MEESKEEPVESYRCSQLPHRRFHKQAGGGVRREDLGEDADADVGGS